MFTVITAATNRDLTTLANLKADLDITGTAEDLYLQRAIKNITSRVCSYLNVPFAQDGTRTFGWEELNEKFVRSPWLRADRCEEMVLARKPVTDIVSVTVAGVLLDSSGYEFDGPAGILRRVWTPTYGGISALPSDRTVVQFKAGWKLPGDDSPTIPDDIEAAVIEIIKGTRAARTRDPLVKTQWVTNIERLDFWVGSVAGNGENTSGLPPDLTGLLDPYCYEPM